LSSVTFWTGKATLEYRFRQLDNEAERDIRKIEKRGMRVVAEALEKQLRLALPNEGVVEDAVNRLSLGDEILKDALTGFINEAILLGTDNARSEIDVVYGVEKQFDNLGLDDVAGEAIGWVTQRINTLMQELSHTSRDTLQKLIAQWKGNDLPFSSLIDTLERAGWGFDLRRAKMIVETEATRAFNKGKLMVAASSALTMHKRWVTAGDERVCPICTELGSVRYASGEGVGLQGDFEHPGGSGAAEQFGGQLYQQPPAHPNCRCKVRLVVVGVPVPL